MCVAKNSQSTVGIASEREGESPWACSCVHDVLSSSIQTHVVSGEGGGGVVVCLFGEGLICWHLSMFIARVHTDSTHLC